MPILKSRADALREYLTGAGSDGGAQTNPLLSFGNFRSASEALSLGITITSPISGVSVLYAGGANPIGAGTLTAVDTQNLTWQPAGATLPGLPVQFTGTQTLIVEALNNPGQYLRITATAPFTPGPCTVSLAYLYDNVFAMDDVTATLAVSGVSEYLATMVRNEGSGPVSSFQRWLAVQGTPQLSGVGVLGASGAGTIITGTSFADWPSAGWCQIRTAGGALKEVVYYIARTLTALTVPAAGRGLLGTSNTAGAFTDVIYPTPGVAIGVDNAGIQAIGSSIQTIANINTPPSSIAWSVGLNGSTGLTIGTMAVNTEVGIWIWRQIPAGILSSPQLLTMFQDSFNSF